jgi:hypothetical protein
MEASAMAELAEALGGNETGLVRLHLMVETIFDRLVTVPDSSESESD